VIGPKGLGNIARASTLVVRFHAQGLKDRRVDRFRN
jgi:hypothetical protein